MKQDWRLWREQDNPKQARFQADGGWKTNKQIEEEQRQKDAVVYCPFCLFSDKSYRFGAGKMKTCPECGQKMHEETLMKEMTPYQFGVWVYDYIVLYRGYGRFRWEKLKQRLKNFGMANDFWQGFRWAKSENASKKAAYEMTEEEYLASKDL